MFYYIFYKILEISKNREKNWPEDMRTPIMISLFSLSFLQCLNIITLLAFARGIDLIQLNSLKQIHALVSSIILFVTNYTFIVYRKRFEDKKKIFDRESAKIKKIKTILFWLYVILSFVFFLVTIEYFKTNQG